MIPDAGILNKLAPEPDSIPVFDTLNKVVPADSKVNESAPAETEAVTTPDFILSNVKSPAVVIGCPFNVALPINCITGELITVFPVETLNPAFKLVTPLFTVNPFANVPNPTLDIVNKLLAPLLTVKLVNPGWTEADIDPDEILNVLTFNPEIAEAGILDNPAPDPEKYWALAVIVDKLPEISTDPVNRAGPILIKVLEPVTVKVPITVKLPENMEEPVLFTPVLPVIVPGGPSGPAKPLGPKGPGDVTCTTFILAFGVTILVILLLL